MKKILFLIFGVISVLFIGVFSYGAKNELQVRNLDYVNNILVENYDFGTYNVTNGWIKVEDFVSNDSFLYCANGEQNNFKPNNIMVKYGTNRYSLNEIQTFAESINSL